VRVVTRRRWTAGGHPSPAFSEGGLRGPVGSAPERGDEPVLGIVGDLPGWPIGDGDRFRVVAGCDKTAETCRAKFSNFLNFRGFPHIPGDDWVTAYPKNGAVHDGSSLQG